jgi:hypothetical protein
MQFCPKCDNIMDIGKSAPKITINQNTPDTVSSDSKDDVINNSNNDISKLIEMYKNGENITMFKIDIKDLTSHPNFNKLKDTDKNNILKIIKSTEIDDSLSAYRICKNCSYFEKMVGKTLVLSRMNLGSSMSSVQDLSKYKYMIHDKTLPHTRDYVCKNDKCISQKDFSKRDAVWFRPQSNSYSTCYACVACSMVWNVS